MPQCMYKAPARRSVEIIDDFGNPIGKYFTREWEKGEKAWYTRTVLQRDLSPSEQEEEQRYQEELKKQAEQRYQERREEMNLPE